MSTLRDFFNSLYDEIGRIETRVKNLEIKTDRFQDLVNNVLYENIFVGYVLGYSNSGLFVINVAIPSLNIPFIECYPIINKSISYPKVNSKVIVFKTSVGGRDIFYYFGNIYQVISSDELNSIFGKKVFDEDGNFVDQLLEIFDTQDLLNNIINEIYLQFLINSDNFVNDISLLDVEDDFTRFYDFQRNTLNYFFNKKAIVSYILNKGGRILYSPYTEKDRIDLFNNSYRRLDFDVEIDKGYFQILGRDLSFYINNDFDESDIQTFDNLGLKYFDNKKFNYLKLYNKNIEIYKYNDENDSSKKLYFGIYKDYDIVNSGKIEILVNKGDYQKETGIIINEDESLLVFNNKQSINFDLLNSKLKIESENNKIELDDVNSKIEISSSNNSKITLEQNLIKVEVGSGSLVLTLDTNQNKIIIDGDVEINGDLIVSGDVKAGVSNISLTTHTHNYVDTPVGGSVTAPPNP
ncbi:MAG: hypothetical protein KatS3mg068_1502 [Candidatus Sericytochromatia bacterium]|nr:MAG: hypothetical protein KatS3mg068_1502 [Candidatus Sericytochromatia bacterium]